MKPPFELPIWIDNDKILVAADAELICHTEAATPQELRYLAHAANMHPFLIAALRRLLNCPDLNLEDMEIETLAARSYAYKLLGEA